MNRDQYLKNALELWKVWVGERKIKTRDIKPIMELLLYYCPEPVTIKMDRFLKEARTRYLDFHSFWDGVYNFWNADTITPEAIKTVRNRIKDNYDWCAKEHVWKLKKQKNCL